MNRNEWTQRKAGRAYNLVAWGLFAAVLAQVFLAGYALLVDPVAWAWHVGFVHLVEFLPIVMAGVAGFTKAPPRFLWFALAALGLIWLQYVFIQFPVALLRPLHPTNAVVLGILAWTAATTSRSPKEPTQ